MNIGVVLNGTVYLQASLKPFELDERKLEEKYGLSVRELDYNSKQDIEVWCDIIHNSYDDCHFTIDSARHFLKEHPVFENTQTFVFQHVNGGYLATVSIGQYKTNPKVGGDFRIGVKNEAQGKGLGRICIVYAFSKLAERGLKIGESAIAFKRKESLYLHYATGFRPQLRNKYLAFKTTSLKRFNIILKFRQYLNYHSFVNSENKKFIK